MDWRARKDKLRTFSWRRSLNGMPALRSGITRPPPLRRDARTRHTENGGAEPVLLFPELLLAKRAVARFDSLRQTWCRAGSERPLRSERVAHTAVRARDDRCRPLAQVDR